MELEEVHDCEQSHGKIVFIEVDDFGNTSCGYCHTRVDYRPYYNNLYKKGMLEIIEELKIRKEESNQKWLNQKKKKKERKSVQEKYLETL